MSPESDSEWSEPKARGLWIALGLAALCGIVGFALGGQVQSPEQAALDRQAGSPSPVYVPVEQRRLTSSVVTRALVEYQGSLPLRLAGSVAGSPERLVVTVAPTPGDTIESGDVTFAVSGRPVFVLDGPIPMYRSLQRKASGPDVEQLEAALEELGFDPGPLDGSFDAQTEQALAAFYQSRGYEVALDSSTRRAIVPAGEIIFASVLPFRIDEVKTPVGSEATGELATASSNQIAAMASVTTTDLAAIALEMTVEFDDPSLTTPLVGTIVDIAEQSGTGGAVAGQYAVTIEFDNPESALKLEGVSVRAQIIIDQTDGAGVIVVPLAAIVQHADGKTTIARRSHSGPDQEIEVTIGFSAEGYAAVTGTTLTTQDSVLIGLEQMTITPEGT